MPGPPSSASPSSPSSLASLASSVSSATSVDFAAAARMLSRAARAKGLIGPSYRCPPRLVGVDRSIRRRGEGVIVSVRLRGRPWAAVLADMIEGVVAANRLQAPHADRLRAEMWAVCGVTPTVRLPEHTVPVTRVA
ncbi:MAG TPA: hypothetical protein VMM60_14115 [Ilumatobacter sp.]|nr:hypothetical protein [Ilumatobacter sp.]